MFYNQNGQFIIKRKDRSDCESVIVLLFFMVASVQCLRACESCAVSVSCDRSNHREPSVARARACPANTDRDHNI